MYYLILMDEMEQLQAQIKLELHLAFSAISVVSKKIIAHKLPCCTEGNNRCLCSCIQHHTSNVPILLLGFHWRH